MWAFSFSISEIFINTPTETTSKTRKFIFAFSSPNVTKIFFATQWQVAIVPSATVIVVFAEVRSKSNFLAKFLGIRFGTSPVSSRQWVSVPCSLKEKKFKLLWDLRFVSFASFFFLRTALFLNSFSNSFWSRTVSFWSMCPKDSLDAVLESALASSYQASISHINPISSVFFALPFVLFYLIEFASTVGGFLLK